MAISLLLRRICLNPKPLPLLKPFSTTSPDPSSSLSASMSFVFDQIDALERGRLEKDETLQRIRAWRQSKTNPPPPPQPQNAKLVDSKNEEELKEESGFIVENSFAAKTEGKEVEVVHPWPEWIELVERLIGQNYFDHRRRDEDRLVNLGIDGVDVGNDDGDSGDAAIDVNDFKTVQAACLNFGKDRFDILRSLSRQDIQHLVGYGCPRVDRKVVFSAKALRKHVHLDEGDVCSNCSLRSYCDKGFLLLNKEDEARTIDVMRVLLTYGFDPIDGLVANKSLLKQKTVKTAVRKLLHDVVRLSAVPIDPNLPPPVIKRPPPKVKQPPPPPKKRVGRDDIEMKKGDWLCPKCDFMNFAKNTVCLQCDAKRPKRQLLPGEWECPECNFLNYRRNMSCFHCECKRLPDTFVEDKMEDRQHGRQTRLEKIPNRAEVSNAWNFDFDDDESDGADVAAFEYADSAAIRDASSLSSEIQEGKFGEPDNDLNIASRFQGAYQREHYQSDHNRERIGFNDFDDEDDVESYELETENSPARTAFQDNFSQEPSDSEDVEVPRMNMHSHPSTSSQSHMKTSRHKFSDFEDDKLDVDSDEERLVRPKHRSSHVVDAKRKIMRYDTSRQLRRTSFGPDEELELDSDAGDDFCPRGRKENKWASGGRKSSGSSDLDDVSFSEFQSDDDVGNFRGNKTRGDKAKMDKRGNRSRTSSDYEFAKNAEVRRKGNMGGRRSSWDNDDDFERSPHGNNGDSRRIRDNSHDRQRSNNRGDSWNNKTPNRAGIQSRQKRSSRDNDDGFERSPHGNYGDNRRFRDNSHDRQRSNNRGDSWNNKTPNRAGIQSGQKRSSWDDDDGFERSSHGNYGNNRRFRDNSHDRQRSNNRGNSWDNKAPNRARSQGRQQGRSRGYDTGMDKDFGEFPNSRRVNTR